MIQYIRSKKQVTPCAGVWIEISYSSASSRRTFVTPCAGVWIEIYVPDTPSSALLSLPVRECGLKWRYMHGRKFRLHVTPCAGVWIEIKLPEKK